MRTIEHGAHLVQLSWYGVINAYLVRESDGLTLVDAGLPGTAPEIVAAARGLDLPITRILLTHAHLDHAGALDGLRLQLPDARLFVARREARLLLGDRTPDIGEPTQRPRGIFPRLATLADRLVDSGDRVGSLIMIPSPGHTPGHVAWLDTRDRTLLAGDAFVMTGGLAVAGVMRAWFPFPTLSTWHRPWALESARALTALRPTRLAVGHGAVLDAPHGAMQRALLEAEGHPDFAIAA